MLRPSTHPRSSNPSLSAATRACPSASVSVGPDTITPSRRTRSDCCASAASGHTTVTPPRSVMNSRRRMGFIPLAENHLYQFEFELLAAISALILIKRCQGEQRLVDVRFGSKADIWAAPIDVPFTPTSGH